MVLAIALVLAVQITSAMAEEQMSIIELSDQTPDLWQETYQAHGREIAVSVPIEIPETSAFPVLLGSKKSAQVPDSLVEVYRAKERTYKEMVYLNTVYNFTVVVNHPTDARKKGKDAGLVAEHDFDFKGSDWNKAYAEENELTLQEAWDIAANEIQRCYQIDAQAELSIDYIMLNDIRKEYHYKTKEFGLPLNTKGSYHFRFFQKFHDIPVINMVTLAYNKPLKKDSGLGAPYVLDAVVADSDSFTLYFGLIQEDEVLYKDVPLCPFENIKKQIEALISQGLVRDVHTVRLGYAGFFAPGSEEKLCFYPCWFIECDYFSSAKKEIDKNEVLSFRHNVPFTTLLFNAQTGEMFNADNKKNDRSDAPKIITY